MINLFMLIGILIAFVLLFFLFRVASMVIRIILIIVIVAIIFLVVAKGLGWITGFAIQLLKLKPLP